MKTKDRNRMHTVGRPPRQRKPADLRPKKESEVQIQYTPAKPFNRNRFLLHLATVVAVVLALVFGMSVFFKTGQVVVSGAEKYTPWEVKEAAGIQDGDALLTLSEAKITAKIRQKLPYVGDVRVRIKLPNTVKIEIKELEVFYAIEDSGAGWWLMDAAGRIIDTTNAAAAKDYTRILGVQIETPEVGKQAVAAEPDAEQDETQAETDPVVPTLPAPPAADKLSAAITILTALEKNGVMGMVETVDVTETGELMLGYDNRYQVRLGDTSRMEYKIAAMKTAIQKMGQYQSGYLDASFTIWPNDVGYKHFDE